MDERVDDERQTMTGQPRYGEQMMDEGRTMWVVKERKTGGRHGTMAASRWRFDDCNGFRQELTGTTT